MTAGHGPSMSKLLPAIVMTVIHCKTGLETAVCIVCRGRLVKLVHIGSDLRNLMELRKTLHRTAYQHKTVKKLEQQRGKTVPARPWLVGSSKRRSMPGLASLDADDLCWRAIQIFTRKTQERERERDARVAPSSGRASDWVSSWYEYWVWKTDSEHWCAGHTFESWGRSCLWPFSKHQSSQTMLCLCLV